MKKIVTAFSTLALVAVFALPAKAQVGIGINGQYGMDFVDEFQIGGEVLVPFANSFKFVPNFEYYLVDDPTTFTVNADVHYSIGAQYTRNFTPYVGVGVGATRRAFENASNTEIGFNLIGGANFNTGAAQPFFQVEYRAGEYGDLSVGGGVRFMLR